MVRANPARRCVQVPEQGEAEQASPGYHGDKDAVLKRLRRSEGQIRGLRRLVQGISTASTYSPSRGEHVTEASRAIARLLRT
ncbi:metal-sensitive transcriptional regulator [Streptomyces canus]